MEENIGKKPCESELEEKKAKTYNRIKLIISLIDIALFIAFCLIILRLGFSQKIAAYAAINSSNLYLQLIIFCLILGIFLLLLTFPLNLYADYYLEHRFALSRQTIRQWLWEEVKHLLVNIIICMPLLLIFYYFLLHFAQLWWLPVGAILFLFSVLLAKLAPLVIFPLFYKFSQLEEKELEEKLLNLCQENGLRPLGVYSFNMGKKTKKANAGFTGLGKSKRIILGDTLLNNFSHDEILSIFRHELGHYHYKHLWKNIINGAVISFAGLFFTAELYRITLVRFNFSYVHDLGALPLLSLYLMLFGFVTLPLSNTLSRRFEQQADRYALKTKDKEPFISAMLKLQRQNLADSTPHPLVEFLFYSHPSIRKRIALANRQSQN